MTYTPLKNALFYTIQDCTKGFEKTQFQELSETEFNHTEAFEFSSEPLGAGLERLALRRHIPNLSTLSQKFLSDWSILPGTAKHLTDFAGGGKYVIVSDRAKSFIEKHDIGHSRFVPLHIFERPDMSPVQGLWYYWIFTQSFQIKRETEDSKKRLLTSSRMSVDITWEAVNNPVFRNYIRGLPFWCQFANFGKVAVRKDIFIEMNEMGLTGLHEIASDTTIGREPGTTVGHLI